MCIGYDKQHKFYNSFKSKIINQNIIRNFSINYFAYQYYDNNRTIFLNLFNINL